MQHETLSMYLHRDPLNISIDLWILHVKTYHIPLHRPVIERFPDRIVVEVTDRAKQSAISSSKPGKPTASP